MDANKTLNKRPTREHRTTRVFPENRDVRTRLVGSSGCQIDFILQRRALAHLESTPPMPDLLPPPLPGWQHSCLSHRHVYRTSARSLSVPHQRPGAP
jgi:hypothetical protein